MTFDRALDIAPRMQLRKRVKRAKCRGDILERWQSCSAEKEGPQNFCRKVKLRPSFERKNVHFASNLQRFFRVTFLYVAFKLLQNSCTFPSVITTVFKTKFYPALRHVCVCVREAGQTREKCTSVSNPLASTTRRGMACLSFVRSDCKAWTALTSAV